MNPGLAKALVKAQAEFPSIPKDSQNPHFKNKFASLHVVMEKVLPVLNDNGLALMQFPTQIEGQPALRTKLVHAETGEYEEDVMLLVLAKNDPQSQGSALSYARRYALLSTLGLVADEDDDGQSASRPKISENKNKNGLASRSQVAMIHALIKEVADARGADTESARSALKTAVGVESMKDLPAAKASEMLDILAGWQEKAKAT